MIIELDYWMLGIIAKEIRRRKQKYVNIREENTNRWDELGQCNLILNKIQDIKDRVIEEMSEEVLNNEGKI